ncbi:MAG: RDD family protein [Acidobacteriota bacterium]|nr:RDD family protein [Acidobacteriota bacterium]
MESSPPIPASPQEQAQESPIAFPPPAPNEGLTAELTTAPLLKRFLAYCVDWGIIGALSYPVIFLGVVLFAAIRAMLTGLLVNQDTTSFGNGFLAPIVVLLLALVFLLAYLSCIHGYFIYYHWKQGAIPGKLIFKLQVHHVESGRYIGYWHAFGRETLGKFISTIVLFLGFLLAVFHPEKRAFHDLIFKTRVVRSAK